MKNLKNLILAVLTIGGMTLTGCLHIIEEVTFKNSGKGKYSMTIDMSEVKAMMQMLQSMPADSLAAAMPGQDAQNPMGQLGGELSNVASMLKGIEGVTNVAEINDTTSFKFGYSFDFSDVASLNRAMKVIAKDKNEDQAEEDVFKFSNKNFERMNVGDMGEQIKKAMSEGEDGGEEMMDMMLMMFADMSYKQIYNFPDREIKKSSHELSELSNDNHTMTITLKPFDEEQREKKLTVATEVKLK